ncbi:MAG: hypothetical protein PWQ27_1687, partial [Kosmotoga sp.]|nr:hypothetical protein [Kosmotoga sp.]
MTAILNRAAVRVTLFDSVASLGFAAAIGSRISGSHLLCQVKETDYLKLFPNGSWFEQQRQAGITFL